MTRAAGHRPLVLAGPSGGSTATASSATHARPAPTVAHGTRRDATPLDPIGARP